MTSGMTGPPSGRFVPPRPRPALPVRFPPISRSVLGSGLRVWTVPHDAIPVISATLVLNVGAASDPPDRPGLAGVTAHLADEGAGTRDAIQLADALARLGTHLDVDVGSDVTALSFTALSRFFEPALGLLADVVTRPHLAATDLARVRDLRLNRLRQLTRSASTVADRAFLAAVFGPHPYGHGVLGTTRALEALTLDDVRAFYAAAWRPEYATLIVVGASSHERVAAMAEAAFGHWGPAGVTAAGPAIVGPPASAAPGAIRLVDRPGAPQSELRVGQIGPPRRTAAYHALVTLNAVVGGEFTSRLNRNLREEKGLTYGACSAFDFRRAGGSFCAQTSVQTDATARAIHEMLRECGAAGVEGDVTTDELAQAKASLTRGYVRHFETGEELLRAAMQLSAYGLEDDTFDRFVPAVEAVTAADLAEMARRFLRPDQMSVVIVGDARLCRDALATLGRPVEPFTPEF